MNNDLNSPYGYFVIFCGAIIGVFILLCYIYYDKNPALRKIGNIILTLKFSKNDKSQLLLISIIIFFCVIMMFISVIKH